MAMSRPEPRPALQRSEDGSVHPAAPRVAPEQHLHPVPHAPAAASLADARARAASRAVDATPPPPTYTGKHVALEALVPKDLRKQVRRVAERSNRSVDEVVAEALVHYIENR